MLPNKCTPKAMEASCILTVFISRIAANRSREVMLSFCSEISAQNSSVHKMHGLRLVKGC